MLVGLSHYDPDILNIFCSGKWGGGRRWVQVGEEDKRETREERSMIHELVAALGQRGG